MVRTQNLRISGKAIKPASSLRRLVLHFGAKQKYIVDQQYEMRETIPDDGTGSAKMLTCFRVFAYKMTS